MRSRFVARRAESVSAFPCNPRSSCYCTDTIKLTAVATHATVALTVTCPGGGGVVEVALAVPVRLEVEGYVSKAAGAARSERLRLAPGAGFPYWSSSRAT